MLPRIQAASTPIVWEIPDDLPALIPLDQAEQRHRDRIQSKIKGASS